MPFFQAKRLKPGRTRVISRERFYELLDTGQYTRKELAEKMGCSVNLVDRMLMERRKAAGIK